MFDFKGLNKKTNEDDNKTSAIYSNKSVEQVQYKGIKIVEETVLSQIFNILGYCVTTLLFVKGLGFTELFPLFLFLAKISFIQNAILKQFEKKSVKHQLISGLTNIGIFSWMYQYNGFMDIYNVLATTFAPFF